MFYERGTTWTNCSSSFTKDLANDGSTEPLEQLDRIAVGVEQLNLLASRANFHFVSKLEAGLLEGLDARRKIGNSKDDSIPAARLLTLTIGERT